MLEKLTVKLHIDVVPAGVYEPTSFGDDVLPEPNIRFHLFVEPCCVDFAARSKWFPVFPGPNGPAVSSQSILIWSNGGVGTVFGFDTVMLSSSPTVKNFVIVFFSIPRKINISLNFVVSPILSISARICVTSSLIQRRSLSLLVSLAALIASSLMR